MKRLLFLLLFPLTTHAGDGPGGVEDTTASSSLRLWLRAGDTVLEPNPGDANRPQVIRWPDASGSGVDFAPDNVANFAVKEIGRSPRLSRFSHYIPPTQTRLFLRLDDDPGDLALDAFSTSRSGTYEGGFGGSISFFGSRGAEFNGTDTIVRLAGSQGLNSLTKNFTISVWIKPDLFGGFQRIISSDRQGEVGGAGWGLGLIDNRILFTTYGVQDSPFGGAEGNTAGLDANAWNHLQFSFYESSGEGLVGELTVNGVARERKTNLAEARQSAGDYVLGSLPGVGQFFSGGMADLLITDFGAMDEAAYADLRNVATSDPANGQDYITLDVSERRGFSAPGNWQAEITDSASVFIVSRYPESFYTKEGDLASIPGYSDQALVTSAFQDFMIHLPDEDAKIRWSLGDAGFREDDPNDVLVDFLHSGRDDAHGFRSFGFFAGPSVGRQITENGLVLGSFPNITQPAEREVEGLTLGTRGFTEGSDLDPDIAEMIIFNRELSAFERIIVQNYLSAKYGLSSGPNDFYRGDLPEFGDFDHDVIGIGSFLASQPEASGGGLTLTDVSLAQRNDVGFLFAGKKTGGLPMERVKAQSDMVLQDWWYFDLRPNEGTLDQDSEVRVRFDLARMDLTLPPATEFQLLHTPSLLTDFSTVATATLSGTELDFGILDVGSGALASGYYAIGYTRRELVPARVYQVVGTSSPNVIQRNGTVWTATVGPNSSDRAGLALAQILQAINDEAPNDGSVTLVDLRDVRFGSTPYRMNAFPLPIIERNLVIQGPSGIAPGLLVVSSRMQIADASVTLDSLEISVSDQNTAPVPIGAGITAFNSDLYLRECIIRGNSTRPSAFNVRGLGDESPLAASGRESGVGFGGGRGGFDGDFVGLGGGGFGATHPLLMANQGGADAGLGGGLYLHRGRLRLFRTGFLNNSAVGQTGGFRRLGNLVTDRAAGLGGAMFLWEEARLESVEESVFIGNTASSVTSDLPELPRGSLVSSNTFYAPNAPSDESLTAVSELLDRVNYRNPVTGEINPASPLAYQFRLYQKEVSGAIVPQYQLLTLGGGQSGSGFASEEKLAMLVEQISELDRIVIRDADASLLARSALDLRYHYAMLNGLLGDAARQRCIEAPLDPTGPTDLDAEIEALTEALANYTRGIQFYLDYILSDAGRENYLSLVPQTPYLQFYYENGAGTNDFREIPTPPSAPWEQTSYRDFAMLFELLSDYGKTSEMLVDFLQRRDGPGTEEIASDTDRALAQASTGLCSLELWADLLLEPFREVEFNEDQHPGIRSSIGVVAQSIVKHGSLQSNILGQTNPLGFNEDFLLLTPGSNIQGTPNNYENTFHSYDRFIAQIQDPTTGVLPIAEQAFADARAADMDYVDSAEEIAMQATRLRDEYRDRLRQITGDFPDGPDFATPATNIGSEIWEQTTKIFEARGEIERNRIRITALINTVQIEVRRNEAEKGIGIDRRKLAKTYGDKIGRIDTQIAQIQLAQDTLSMFTDLLDPEQLSNPAGLAITGVKALNVAAQAGAEIGKMELEKQKEELVAEQDEAEFELDQDLLDIESQAVIDTAMQEMQELDLDSKLTAATLRQELDRLAALYDEVKFLENSIATAENSIATRFFADPAARLEVQQSFQDALFKFQEAQRWLFFATRALEYKWNQPFADANSDGSIVTLQTLFQIRKPEELRAYLVALGRADVSAMNSTTSAGQPLDYFSLRDHLFKIPFETAESGPLDRSALFRERLAPFIQEDGTIAITFSTARSIPNSAFFDGPTFNNSGNIVNNDLGNYLDKINGMRVLLTFEDDSDIITQDRSAQGNLSYGGVSYIRRPTPGSFDPDQPDRIINEMTTFSTETWQERRPDPNDPNSVVLERWIQDRAPVPQQITAALGKEGTRAEHEALVEANLTTSRFNILNFQERSVAAANWRLNVPSRDGNQARFDLEGLTDIKIRFQHFTATRRPRQ